MKSKYFVFSFFALLALGCSHDDESYADSIQLATENNDSSAGSTKLATVSAPAWSVDLTGNEVAPTWESPTPSKFESSMFLMVKLQEELEPYSTDRDLMAIFIGNECRSVPAVPQRVDNGDVYFVLKVRGNSIDRDVSFTLSYYCASLHQIFNLTGKESFATERTYGVDKDFEPRLLRGCKKYPVQDSLTVSLPADSPITATANDLVAAFIGDECRGVGTIGKAFTLFRTNEGEVLQLRYYSAQENAIYTMKQVVNPNEMDSITLAF
jgi:hypothetical protein